MQINIRIFKVAEKRMFRSDQLSHIVIHRNGEWQATIWDVKSEKESWKTHEPLHRVIASQENAILMLSAGIPDSQGNEIFEDDVVEYEVIVGRSKLAVAVVKWDCTRCGFILMDENGQACGHLMQAVRVICNLHQIPKLSRYGRLFNVQ